MLELLCQKVDLYVSADQLLSLLQCQHMHGEVSREEAHRQDCIEDQIVPQGLNTAISNVEMPRVSILLMEGQQREHDHKAIPVRQLPPRPQQFWMSTLFTTSCC